MTLRITPRQFLPGNCLSVVVIILINICNVIILRIGPSYDLSNIPLRDVYFAEEEHSIGGQRIKYYKLAISQSLAGTKL